MQATALAQGQGSESSLSAADQGLAADLYALISHLHRNCTADLFEAVGAVELSLSQVKLLHHVDDATSELTLKQAAEAIHLSLPAASRLVEDLVARGLVERHEDVEDRRMKRIRLTDQGRVVVARVNAARLSGLENFVTTLDRTDRQALGEVLARLLARDGISGSRHRVGLRR
jgi:DNA-binding MarR family transcriptional regulator